MPFILGPGFLESMFPPADIMGMPASLFTSADHHINEKYLHAVGREIHNAFLQ